MSDRIELRGLRVVGYHGVFEEERRNGQTFVIDADLETDLSAAGHSDRLDDTVDYGRLAERLAEVVRSTRFDLIEALASSLADVALEDPRVVSARVRVAKPQAPTEVDLDEAAVVVLRGRGTGERAR